MLGNESLSSSTDEEKKTCKRIRLIGLALLATSALAVTAASAASAHSFKAQTYPATVKAHAVNPQGFQISGSVSVCSKATFEGTATAESETLEVHPKYEGCEVELAGTFKAKVNTEGCNYAVPRGYAPDAGRLSGRGVSDGQGNQR